MMTIIAIILFVTRYHMPVSTQYDFGQKQIK